MLFQSSLLTSVTNQFRKHLLSVSFLLTLLFSFYLNFDSYLDHYRPLLLLYLFSLFQADHHH